VTPYRPFDGDAWLGQEIPLTGGPYQMLPESAIEIAGEMAFARQGRKARVYKLLGPGGEPYALKVFYRGFSVQEYLQITEALKPFGNVEGLSVCRRRVVGREEAEELEEPGLTNAILMPWIDGVAWAGVVERRHPLPEATCLALFVRTARVLAQLEERNLAHADISSTNVLVTNSLNGPTVELIDVEDMYHDSFGPLPYVPDGSTGYAHPANRGLGCRNRYGDRFAGAMLLSEMLTWHDPAIRRSTADVSLFEEGELCQDGAKYDLVRKVLQAHSADLARLFEQAWDSPGLAGCPPLADWAEAIYTVTPIGDHPQETVPGAATAGPDAERAPMPCPSCAQPVRPDGSVEHGSRCPLRPPVSPAQAPSKSSFPGVPTYEDIGFVPLFNVDEE
jgi:serine/threonine protein kinase